MQLELTPAVRCRSQGKGGPFTVRALQQQVLTRVVAWLPPGRQTQEQAYHIAAEVLVVGQLTAQLPHRQFARQQYTVPEHHAVLQRLGHAGQQLAMVADFPALPDAAFHQQGGADMAIAVATALRAFIPKALRRIEDAFARPDIEHGTGGLQGYFHKHVIIERGKPAKAPGAFKPIVKRGFQRSVTATV